VGLLRRLRRQTSREAKLLTSREAKLLTSREAKLLQAQLKQQRQRHRQVHSPNG
jgi:hypothetical protein